MLFHDDVMTDGEAESGAFACRLGGEERIEHLGFYFRWDAGAIVANPDLDAVTEVFRGGREDWLETFGASLRFALGGGIKAVGNQIEQDPGDLLRKQIDLARARIERSLERNIEALLLRPRAMIGEIEAFFDDGIDVDR